MKDLVPDALPNFVQEPEPAQERRFNRRDGADKSALISSGCLTQTGDHEQRLRVLISAYACSPLEGSEPGVGWHFALEASKFHDVWVMTPKANREAIETVFAESPTSHLHFVYHDISNVAKWLIARRQKTIHSYPQMFLWHLTARRPAQRLHDAVGFNLAHHVTYCSIRNWTYLTSLGIPFIWGPVGGGEQTPRGLLNGLPGPTKAKEIARILLNALVRFDPLVHHTIDRATLILAATQDSANRLPARAWGRTLIMQNIHLDLHKFDGETVDRGRAGFTLMFAGRLLYWKGVDLALEALTYLPPGDQNVTLTIIGDGPDRQRLESLTKSLGLGRRVTFLGALAHEHTLHLLPSCDAFIFPSLHDSGGMAVIEAMAAKLPVICLNTGGPAMTVTDANGYRISVASRAAAVRDIATAIHTLMRDPTLRLQMGDAGRQRVVEQYLWEHVGPALATLYARVAESPPCSSFE